MLYGFPVATTDAMDAPGTSGFPIAFGSWDRGYGLVDRGVMRVTANPLSSPGFVRFYVRRRLGAAVVDNAALKLLSF
jgi:HK97 family phage major capsid protein